MNTPNSTFSAEELTQIDAELREVEEQLDLIAGSVNNADVAARIRALSAKIGQRRGRVVDTRDRRPGFITSSAPAATPPKQVVETVHTDKHADKKPSA